MKKERTSTILTLLVGLLIIALVSSYLSIIVTSTWVSELPYSIKFKVNGYTQENAIVICSGKNLEDTSLCLNAFVKGVYNYVPTDDNEILDFDKIISGGNDCRGWNYIYESSFNQLGFKTKRIIVDVLREENTQYKHIFLIASNENGWCSLDQTDVNCFRYIR